MHSKSPLWRETPWRRGEHTHRHSMQYLMLIWELHGPKSVPVLSRIREGASAFRALLLMLCKWVSPRNLLCVGVVDHWDQASLISFSMNCKCNFSCCTLGKVQQQDYPPTVDLLKWFFFFKWMEKREKEMIRRIKLYCLYIFFPIILSKMEGSLTFSSNFFSVSYHWRFFFFEKKITIWKVRIITSHILPILPPFLLRVFLLLWPKFFTWSQTLCLWHHSGCCGGDYDVQSQKG